MRMRIDVFVVVVLLAALATREGMAQPGYDYEYKTEFVWGITKNTSSGLIGGFIVKQSKAIRPGVYRTLGLELVNVKHANEVRLNSIITGNFFIWAKEIWKYRDWVIKAFNADMPFDQFTIEQLAGDLLPDPSINQLVATAFHRNTLNNGEGGTDNEEYRIFSVIDRVNTTWEVWQSTTMGCVQCHSHPYDPIRQPEYYSSFAFFNNTSDSVPLCSPDC